MTPASANPMNVPVGNCNGVLTMSGCNVDGYDLLNSTFNFPFHNLTSYL